MVLDMSTHVSEFPINTIIAWIINDYHEQGNIIITNLLLPLGHISNTYSISLIIKAPYFYTRHARGRQLCAPEYGDATTGEAAEDQEEPDDVPDDDDLRRVIVDAKRQCQIERENLKFDRMLEDHKKGL